MNLPKSEVLQNAPYRNTVGIMPVLTLKVSPEIAARLDRMATRRRTSKSVIIREALEEKLRGSAAEPSLYELMKSTIGTVDSGMTDLGHNPKHLSGFGRR
jgi:predicted transcriptional regulator